MRKLTLLKANIRRQKGTFIGLFLLVLITSMALCALLAIYDNSHRYEMEELNRTGYEEIAAWTGNGQDFSYLNNLIKEIENLPDVDGVTEEKIIYSRYSVAGKEADYTLQMKSYEKEAFRYYLLKMIYPKQKKESFKREKHMYRYPFKVFSMPEPEIMLKYMVA